MKGCSEQMVYFQVKLRAFGLRVSRPWVSRFRSSEA